MCLSMIQIERQGAGGIGDAGFQDDNELLYTMETVFHVGGSVDHYDVLASKARAIFTKLARSKEVVGIIREKSEERQRTSQ
jgi:hypothetical protein